MIDVLLVNTEEKEVYEKIPPVELASIAGYLGEREINVRIIDFNVERKPLEHWLELFKPKFLGIFGTTLNRFDSFTLARNAKSYDKGIIVIYFGPNATFTAKEVLENIPEIDFVIRGEAEDIFYELLKTFSTEQNFEKIRGLSFRLDGVPVENPPARRLDFDSLPQPSYHLLDMKKYEMKMEFIKKKGMIVFSSRGCLHHCNFCLVSRMYNYLLTVRSAKNVVDEIERLLKEYHFQGIRFGDCILTLDREHIESLCDEIINRNLQFPWECEIRPETVDESLLEKMKRAGCYLVGIGIESGSQKVLDLMRKGITVEQAKHLLELCNRAGMKIKAFFSFGHISETMADVKKTFEFIEENRDLMQKVEYSVGLRIYPGTYLETFARKSYLLPADFDWTKHYDEPRNETIMQPRNIPILIQPQLGYEELESIALKIYTEKLSGWEGIKSGISKLTQPEKLKKLQQFLKLKFKKIK
jgi:anaerobic magnesium-protoporphyrin IX monomethyl ester cyclase|uniref:B12-binding domain-containing radical SAM protein n=1 Tax=candidate division WOR-3 bacterium TaxID=2052148 RepID=A0A7V3RI27_UNCW3